MRPVWRSVAGTRPLLLALAAPAEVRAAQRGLGLPERDLDHWKPVEATPDVWLLRTGVGKSDAAGATASALATGAFGAVINAGIAGALPGPRAPALLGVVVASASRFADEGSLNPGGFVGLDAMGFPPTPGGLSIEGHRPLRGALVADVTGAVEGVIATVSTCSGTDELAAEVSRRTGAVAEAMEGAAAGLAAWRLGAPYAEVRVISNTTGARERQRWDLPGSLAVLARVIGEIGRGGDRAPGA